MVWQSRRAAFEDLKGDFKVGFRAVWFQEGVERPRCASLSKNPSCGRLGEFATLTAAYGDVGEIWDGRLTSEEVQFCRTKRNRGFEIARAVQDLSRFFESMARNLASCDAMFSLFTAVKEWHHEESSHKSKPSARHFTLTKGRRAMI